jgi:choline dehydrogenase-like flavoprotein
MTDHYDVIVIGSGAGGGTLTHALAPTGKRILLHTAPSRQSRSSSPAL